MVSEQKRLEYARSRRERRQRPASLAAPEFSVVLQELLRESGESVREWCELLPGITLRQFSRCVAGASELSPRQLVALDDLCGNLLLAPPERSWAERSKERSDRLGHHLREPWDDDELLQPHSWEIWCTTLSSRGEAIQEALRADQRRQEAT